MELTQDDLEVAEASIRFAMDNCPVESLLSNEDGTSVTLDELQTLMGRVKEIEDQALPHPKIDDVVVRLRSVIDYTSENCPVEGVATFHDGRPISGRSITALAEKLGRQRRE